MAAASAPTATSSSSFSLPLRTQSIKPNPHLTKRRITRISHFRVRAVQGGSTGPQRAPPGFDTRIHWENDDEGWIGGKTSQEKVKDESDFTGDKFSDLLNSSSDSHYQFLGISPNADLEEIKSAYRRLSKEYHPDTTTLPLRAASEKFMKLREIYDVLSDEETRRFYDWTLAQETASREAEKMRIRLEDPYMKEVESYVPVGDMVDRLGGRNMELNDQAKQALTFDILIIIFSICCIIYVAFFKEQY
ncbi:hypothetical protein ACP275_04G016300 [Erythranthe tilingii]